MDDMLNVKMPTPKPVVKPELVVEEREVEATEPAEEEHVQGQVQEEVSDRNADGPKVQFLPDEEVFNNPPQVKKVKKKCSEKQLAHLAKCREKANEKKTQQRKFKEDQKAKQQRYLEAEERANPPKKKRVYVKKPPPPEIEYVYEEDEEEEEEEEEEESYPEIFHKLTASEIRAIQRDAIQDYEVIRKERKHHKATQQKLQDYETAKQQVFSQMKQPDTDPWDNAFSF
jgi:hypothetical protein